MVIKASNLFYFLSFIVFSNVIVKSIGISGLSDSTNKIDFLILIVLSIFVFPLYKKANSPSIKGMLILFSGYILLSLVSSHRALNGFAFGQMILNFKFPLLILFFYIIDLRNINLNKVERYFLILICLNIFFILLEIVLPNLHHSIFKGAVTNTIVQGTSITRYTGFFIHPAAMGIFASICFLWGTSKLLSKQINNISIALTLLSLVCLFFSGQRMELGACLLITSFILAIKFLNRGAIKLILVTFLFVIITFIVLYLKQINSFNMSLIDEGHARSVLYLGAFQLANEFFPFGSGLGTFGSSMSLNNENAMYQYLGIASYWWFEGASFLTDTHWAMIIGESGYLASIFYFLFLANIFYVCYRNYINQPKSNFIPILGCMLITFSFFSSLATPIYAGTLLPILILSFIITLNFHVIDNKRQV